MLVSFLNRVSYKGRRIEVNLSRYDVVSLIPLVVSPSGLCRTGTSPIFSILAIELKLTRVSPDPGLRTSGAWSYCRLSQLCRQQ